MQKECYTKGMNQSTAHIKFLSEPSSYGSELNNLLPECT